MKKWAFLFSILACFILYPSSKVAAEHYRFVTLEFPPLEYAGEDGTPQGIAVDIVTKIMNKLGHTVDVKLYPWARGLDMVKEGDADAIFTAYKNPERELFLDYSQQVLIPQIVCFYVKKGNPITFDGDLNTVKDKRIGIVSTISYGQKFDQFKPQLQLDRVEELEQNFKKLEAGRIDLVISNAYVAESTLGKLQSTDSFTRLPQEVERVPSYIGFSKKRGLAALRDQFDQELIKLKESGEYTEIMKKYGVDMQIQ
jgi:polar amino acid transport system substrate-binding protein